MFDPVKTLQDQIIYTCGGVLVRQMGTQAHEVALDLRCENPNVGEAFQFSMAPVRSG